MVDFLCYITGYLIGSCIPSTKPDWERLPIRRAEDYPVQSIHHLRLTLHNKILILQRIYRLVGSEQFEQAYDPNNEDDQKEVEEYITDLNKEGLVRWMKYKLREDLSNWNITDLRELGRALSVKNYQYISKDALIETIKMKRK